MSKLPGLFIRQIRNYTSNARRHVLRQNVDQIPVNKYKKSQKGFDNRVYVWGLAETGALGNEKSKTDHKSNHTAIVTSPTRQHFAERNHVVDFACGYGFTNFVVQEENGNHSVYGTGINTDGQLGIQLSLQSKQMELLIYPARIDLLKNLKIKSMDAGRAHCVMVTDNGTMYSLGNNSYGQCARRIVKEEHFGLANAPHKIVLPEEKPIEVVCGQDHTMVLTESGKVFSCGWSSDGQTGIGDYKSTSKLTQTVGDIVGEKIVKLSSAGDCVLALNDKGQLFGWGNSEYGQFHFADGFDPDLQQIHTPRFLAGPEKYGKIIDIAAGGSFCMILNEEGDVFTWGYGVLGFGPEVLTLKEPTKLPSTLFGRNDFNKASRVTSIYAGLFHMGAVTSEQDLYTWGANRYGCLGLGDKRASMFFPFKVSINAKVSKIKFGADHTIALCKPFV